MGSETLEKRKLPKLMACMTRGSLENMRQKAIFNLNTLDSRGIRRRKEPLHKCILLEMEETGYVESAQYFNVILTDNRQLIAADDIGIVVDIKKRPDYLELIASGLQKAEREKEKGNTKKEALEFLELAMYFAKKGKGILWLAEKMFLTSIAVANQYYSDGGRQKNCCKFHYGKFLLDKFPEEDTDDAYDVLVEVRDESIGKNWLLYEGEGDQKSETLFRVSALQLHRILIGKTRKIRKSDPAKAERLSRLSERRAADAEDTAKIAESIIEIGISQLQMDSLQNALKTFTKALNLQTQNNSVEGICEAQMHLAATMQRLGDYENASKMLTDMGALAMENGLRRQLGRALHLLGELHLKKQHPELGTQYLREAFACFMGFNWEYKDTKPIEDVAETDVGESPKLSPIYTDKKEIFIEEAEQARFMMAVSAGQEYMASFFKLLDEAHTCAVARMKAVEWKLSHAGWWIKKIYDDFIPCPCPEHKRSPLDVLRIQQELLQTKSHAFVLEWQDTTQNSVLGRTNTVNDLRALRSSVHKNKFRQEDSKDKEQ